MTNIKDLCESPHSIYKNYNYVWSFLLDSYEGGVDYCKGEILKPTGLSSLKDWAFKIFAGSRELSSSKSGNLFMHPKERYVDYKDRLAMSYYYNFCAPIIDIYTDHLFKQPILEDFGSIESEVGERRENIDNKGSSVDEFRKELADMAQVYGHIFVVADSPQYKGEVNSKQDLIDNNLYPYFTLHHPQNVMNWALDEFGRPYWVVIREEVDSNIDPFNYDKEKNSTIRFRLWTRNEWILYSGDYQELERGVHSLNKVPITCVFDKQSKKVRNFLGVSALADIAFITRDIYNSCSELKQILRDQTFAFLAIQGSSSEYDELSVGTSKGLLYPADRAKPEYVSPPSANAEVYFRHIDRQISKIFQLAKLEGGSAEFVGQNAIEQSGVAKAWDFNQTNSAISKKAGNLEDGETKLWQTFAGWLGKEFDGSIEYPHEFSVKELKDDLEEAEKIMRLNMGAEFNKEIKKAIIQKKFPRMQDEDLDRLIQGMESQEDTLNRTEGSSLLNRIPSLMKIAAQTNATQAVKERGLYGR